MSCHVSLMELEELKKQSCIKHSGQPVTLVSLTKDSAFPTLACAQCMDWQQYQQKQIYISLKKFLDIQKTYKEINYIDVEKQLCELNFVQKNINQIFQAAKLEIVKKANDRKLAQKYNIKMTQPGSLEEECRKQVTEFNEKYLDIEKWIKGKDSADKIDNKVREKYFRQNNAIIELDKILRQAQQCIKYRMQKNKSIDCQLKEHKEKQFFRLGEYSKAEKAQISRYETQYEKQHHSSIFISKQTEYDGFISQIDQRHWFDVTFLRRYLREASIYAKRLDFMDILPFTKQLADLVPDSSKFTWHNLEQIYILNKFSDENIGQIFSIVKSKPILSLEFCQPRQTGEEHEKQLNGRHKEDFSALPEINIKNDINFAAFQQFKFQKLMDLSIDRIFLNSSFVEKMLNSCPNIKSLNLNKNGLEKQFYTYFGNVIKDKKLGHLEELTIVQNNIGLQQAKELFATKQCWSQLNFLNLSCNRIDDPSVDLICNCDFFNLKQLIFNKNKIKSPVALLNKQWKQLKVLALQCNQIQTSFSILLARRLWKQEIFLCLSGNRIIKNELERVTRYKNRIRGQWDWQRKPIEGFIEDFIQERYNVQEQKGYIEFLPKKLQSFQQDYLKNPNQVFHKLDTLYDADPHLTCILLNCLLNQVAIPEQLHQNAEILQQLEAKIQENDLRAIVLLGLKGIFSRREIENPVVLLRKSSIKSQICTKIISTQFLCELVKFQQVIVPQGFNFEELCEDENLLYKIKQSQIERISQQYGIQQSEIFLHKVKKAEAQNQLKIQWLCHPKVQNKVIALNNTKKKLTLTPFFQIFRFSLESFGETTVFGEEVKVEMVGKWPWFAPIKCSMLSINTTRKFDNANNQWFVAENKDAQWPIAYQSMCSTSSAYVISSANCQMAGLVEGQLIKGTGKQANSSLAALNLQGSELGSGYYWLPYLHTSLSNLRPLVIKQKKYCFVLACRIQKIKVCPNNIYWVVNESKHIRPWGIIVVPREGEQINYPGPAEMFGEQQFTWDAYKERIGE